MNELEAYIASGILELYVLDQVNDQERTSVLAMAAKHPEVQDEIAAIERAMEQYAQMNSIESTKELDMSLFTSAKPVDAVDTQPKVVKLGTSGNNRTLQFALAACLGLLVMSTVALFSTYNRLNLANNQLAELRQQKDQYTRNASFMEERNQELKLIADMPYHADWKPIALKGVGSSPSAELTVYWNKVDHKVMVNNHNKVLPAHDESHQYQLWAMVDGKPVDLGVFDSSDENKRMIFEMKSIAGAQAFAVTLEKAGGSASPTMDKMVVMGVI